MTSQGTEERGQVLAHLILPPDLQERKRGAEGPPPAVLPCHVHQNTPHLVPTASGSSGNPKDPRGRKTAAGATLRALHAKVTLQTSTRGQGTGQGREATHGGPPSVEDPGSQCLWLEDSEPLGLADPRPLARFTELVPEGHNSGRVPRPNHGGWGCLSGSCWYKGENVI